MLFNIFAAGNLYIQVRGNTVGDVYNSFFGLLILFAGIVLAISIHEWAHAFTAKYLGDRTAEAYGRVTINPVKHFDPFGFFLLIFAPIAYGKPVPVDASYFSHPKRGLMLVSIAGPISNVVQAIFAGILFIILGNIINPSENIITTFIYTLPYIGIINLSLAIFNMLPIVPLDGSKIFSTIDYKIENFIYVTLAPPRNIFALILLIFPIFGNISILGLIISPFSIIYLNMLQAIV